MAQTEVIEWQKKEIENLKAASMQIDLKKLIEAMTQAMACMYNMQKDPSKKCLAHNLWGVCPIWENLDNHKLPKGSMVQLTPI